MRLASIVSDGVTIRGWTWRCKTSASGMAWGCLRGGFQSAWGAVFMTGVGKLPAKQDFLLSGPGGGPMSYSCKLGQLRRCLMCYAGFSDLLPKQCLSAALRESDVFESFPPVCFCSVRPAVLPDCHPRQRYRPAAVFCQDPPPPFRAAAHCWPVPAERSPTPRELLLLSCPCHRSPAKFGVPARHPRPSRPESSAKCFSATSRRPRQRSAVVPAVPAAVVRRAPESSAVRQSQSHPSGMADDSGEDVATIVMRDSDITDILLASPNIAKFVCEVQRGEAEKKKKNTKPVLVQLGVVVGGFHGRRRRDSTGGACRGLAKTLHGLLRRLHRL